MLLSQKELVRRVSDALDYRLSNDKEAINNILKRNKAKYCTCHYKREVKENDFILQSNVLVFYTGSGVNHLLWCFYNTDIKEAPEYYKQKVLNAAIKILKENQTKGYY